MKGLSDGRISYLAHLIMDSLRTGDLVDFPNESRALRETKEVLKEAFNLEDRLGNQQVLPHPFPPLSHNR